MSKRISQFFHVAVIVLSLAAAASVEAATHRTNTSTIRAKTNTVRGKSSSTTTHKHRVSSSNLARLARQR
jgi:hypothetical protein